MPTMTGCRVPMAAILLLIAVTANAQDRSFDSRASCGNDVCEVHERCDTCRKDCGECMELCGDGVCFGSEDCSSCDYDCGSCTPKCGDGACRSTESCDTCASDCGACPAVCGDSRCDPGESCEACAADCGRCAGIVCGDDACHRPGESCESCAEDCGPCEPQADCYGCKGTACLGCPVTCGDQQCQGSETCGNCFEDCGLCASVCGDLACYDDEDCASCPDDCGECPGRCGDGECRGAENCRSCREDCGHCPYCGDATCNGSESDLTCPGDCDEVPVSTFRDVPEEAWFARSVSAIVQAGIASGYRDTEGNLTGLFGPGDPVTYAEMAKMSLALAGKDTSSAPGAPMNPTAFGQWSEGTIRLAEDLGLTVYAAFPDVNAPAPRGAVLQTVLEAMEIPLHSNTISFDDVPPNHPHAFAIASATMLGIVSGDTDAEGNPTGTFRPDDPINRAEVAKVLVRVGGMHCPP